MNAAADAAPDVLRISIDAKATEAAEIAAGLLAHAVALTRGAMGEGAESTEVALFQARR